MEKRGHIEKLRYDFNTARAVYIKNIKNNYVRITERDFRSHNGERFIFMKLLDGNYDYIPYEGPIYYWGTNKLCIESIGDNRIQYAHEKPWKSLLRPHENKK